MNKVTNYLKNIGKSVGYASLDVLGELAPASSEFITTNSELFKELADTVRDHKQLLRRTKDQFIRSKIYEAADVGFKALKEDLSTGNFYNRERKKSLESRIVGLDDMGDFNDTDFSFGDEGGSDDSGFGNWDNLDAGDQNIIQSIESTSKANAATVSNTISRSTEYIVESQKAMHEFEMLQNLKTFGNMQSSLNTISQNLTNMMSFQTSVHKTHMENSKKFYEEITKLSRENNALLKEFVDMERNRYNRDRENEKKNGSERITVDSILGSSGVPDLKRYMQNVKNNIKSKVSSSTGMLSMFSDGNVLLDFVASPLEFLPKWLVRESISTSLKGQIKKFDKALGSFMGALITKLNTAATGDGMLAFIGQIFGVQNSMNRTLDTAKYQKGAVPWDGIARKALVEVVPTYLRKILAALTGKNEHGYDYETGKFVDLAKLKESETSRYDSSMRNKMGEFIDFMTDQLDTKLGIKDKEKKDKAKKTFFEATKKLVESGKLFDHNKKDRYDEDLGLDAEMYTLYTSAFKAMDRRMQLSFAAAQATTRQYFEEDARRREAFSDALGFQLENNSDSSDFGKFKAKDFSKYVEKVKGGISGGETLISTKDRYGNSIFNYLHDVVTTLRQGIKVVVVGGSTSGPTPSSSLGSRGKNRMSGNAAIDAILNRKETYDTNYSDAISEADKKKSDQERHEASEEKKRKKNSAYTLGYEDLIARADEFGYSENDIIKIIKQHYRGGIKIDESIEAKKGEKTKFETAMNAIHERAKKLDEDKKKRLGDDYVSKPMETKGFMEELMAADNIFAKASIISTRFSKFTEQPLKLVTNILDNADRHMYEFIYGKEDSNPNKPTGFMDALIGNMKDMFSNFNNWLNEQILNPLSNRFKGIGDKIKGGVFTFLDFMGIDHKAIGENIKAGFDDFKGRIGKDARSAAKVGKQSFLEVFKPGFSKLTGKTTIDSVGNKLSSFKESKGDNSDFFNSILSMFDAANVPIYGSDAEKSNVNNIKDIISGYGASKKATADRWMKSLKSHLPAVPKDGNDPFADIRSAINSGAPISDIINMISGRNDAPYQLANAAHLAKLNAGRDADGKKIVTQINDIIKFNSESRTKKTSLFAKAGDELLNGIHKISEAIFGFNMNDPKGEKFKNRIAGFTKDFSINFKKYAPDMASKGILTGLGFGALGIIGGPLAGLALGAGISLARQSDKLQTMLFGEKFENDEGNYKAGQFKGSKLFSRKFMDGFNKYFPDMKKFGIAGGIASILPFVPGGPVAGIIVGSAIGFAKNNEKIQDFLFGEERGLLGPKAKEKLDKYLPKALAGAAIGAGVGLFGPFGLMGGAAIGAATGLLTTNEKFQEFFLGKKNKDGKYEGGVIGGAKSFIKDKIIKPISYAMAPIGHELKNVGKNILKMFSDAINSAFEMAVGAPLREFINDKIIKPLTGFFTKIFGLLTKVLGGILTSPVRALTAVGDSLRTKHIKNNDAPYMNIMEQEDFISKNPVRFLFTRFGGLAVKSLFRNMFDSDSPSPGEGPDKGGMKYRTKFANMFKNIGNILFKGNKQKKAAADRIESEFGGPDVNGESMDTSSDGTTVVEIMRNGKKVKVRRAKTKAGAKIDEMNLQLAERDQRIAQLSERIDALTNPSGAPGTGILTPEELARIYRDNHKHIKLISDEVKGQLDGLGYNSERSANILANAFGDAAATGIKGARGNSRRKGIFGRLISFVTNPIKFLTGKGVELLIGKDGKGGLFGGLFMGIRGIFDNLASIITAPFKAIATAANIFLEGLKAIGPAVGKLIGTAIEVGITTPLKVMSEVIIGISEGIGKAAGHLIEGIGALTGGVMDLVASIPTLVSGIVTLTSEVGKLATKLLGGLAQLVTDGISLAARGLGSLIFGPLQGLQMKMGVYVLGGKLDEVTLVKEVEHVTLVDKLIELEKVSRIKIIETVEKLLNGMGVNSRGNAPTGLFNEYGAVMTDTDSAGGKQSIVPDHAGKMFIKEKIAERSYRLKSLSALTNIERETTETSDNTSFLSKLKNGIGGLFDMLPAILPFLPLIGIALSKLLKYLGILDDDGKDANGASTGDTGHIPRVLANIIAQNKYTKAGLKFATDSISKKIEKEEAKSILEKMAKEGAEGAVKSSADDVAKMSARLTELMAKPWIAKYIDKNMAKALATELFPDIAKSVEKNAFKGVLGAAAKKIATIPFAIWDFSTGMADAAFIFKASNPTWGMRLAAGIIKMLNTFFLFGLIPTDYLVPFVFKIIKRFLPETFVKDVETRQIALEQARVQYNMDHGTNLSITEYNDVANKTFGSKVMDFFKGPATPPGTTNNYASAKYAMGMGMGYIPNIPIGNTSSSAYNAKFGTVPNTNTGRFGVNPRLAGLGMGAGMSSAYKIAGQSNSNTSEESKVNFVRKIFGLPEHLERKTKDIFGITEKENALRKSFGEEALKNSNARIHMNGMTTSLNQVQTTQVYDQMMAKWKSGDYKMTRASMNGLMLEAPSSSPFWASVAARFKDPETGKKNKQAAFTARGGVPVSTKDTRSTKVSEDFFGKWNPINGRQGYTSQGGKTDVQDRFKAAFKLIGGFIAGEYDLKNYWNTAKYNNYKSTAVFGKGGESGEGTQSTMGQVFPFYSQKDRRWSGLGFNSRADKVRQTIGDSGCGPTAESMAITALTGMPVLPTDASNFAISNGHKEANGGTKYSFFDAFAKKYGINTGQMDIAYNGKTKSSITQNIIQKLRNNIPVILMGKDGSGRSPFGKNPHYVLATGVDPSGNIIINNPERAAGGTSYPITSVLSKAIRAIWHTNRKGKGYDPNAPLSDSVLKAMSTSDMIDSADRPFGEETSPDQQSLLDKILGKFGFSSSNDMLDQDLSTAFNGSDMVSGRLGVHGWFGQRLADLARAMGVKLETSSGYRSTAKQTVLWNERRKNHPNESEAQSNRWVARPGTSRHEAGLAIDLATAFYRKLSNATLKKFGLYKPLSWEDWHVEPIETKGMPTADLLAKYGRPGTAKRALSGATAALGQSAPLSKNGFIQKLIPGATAAFKDHNYLLPSITIAQAILESSWGKRGIGNNIFGIKAFSNWVGKKIKSFTHEQTASGKSYGTNAWFRDYDSIGDAIKDHSKILVNGSAYGKFRKATNYVEAAKALQGTYATDHEYASKLISIIKSNGLDKLDRTGGSGMGSGPSSTPKYGMGTKINSKSIKAPNTSSIVRPSYKVNKVASIKSAPSYTSGSGTSSGSNRGQLVLKFIELLAKIVDNTGAINRIASLLEVYLNVAIPADKRTPEALPIVLGNNSSKVQNDDFADLFKVLSELATG